MGTITAMGVSTQALEQIVWSIFLGIVLGAFASFYYKVILGSFVWSLLKEGATSPETAKTLLETGFQRNYFVRLALHEKSTYRKIIYTAESQSLEAAKKFHVEKAHFFIPEEKASRAEDMYSKKGTNLFGVFVTILVFLVVVYLSFRIIPDLINMLNDLLQSIQ